MKVIFKKILLAGTTLSVMAAVMFDSSKMIALATGIGVDCGAERESGSCRSRSQRRFRFVYCR